MRRNSPLAAVIALFCVMVLATACPTTTTNGNTSGNTNSAAPYNATRDNSFDSLEDRKPRELSVRCFGLDVLEQRSFTEVIPFGYVDISVAAGGTDRETVEWAALEAAVLYLYSGALADGEADKLRALDEWDDVVHAHGAWAEAPTWTDADRSKYLSGIEVNNQVRVAYVAFGQWLDTLSWVQMRSGEPLAEVPTPIIGLLAMDDTGAIMTGLTEEQATAQQHLIDAITARGAQAIGLSEEIGALADELDVPGEDPQAETLMTLLPADILIVYYVGRWENPSSYEVELSVELTAMSGQPVATALLEVFVGESDEVETETDAMRVGCQGAIDDIWERTSDAWKASCERGRLYRVVVAGNTWDACDAFDMLVEVCNVVQVAYVANGTIDLVVWAGADYPTSTALFEEIRNHSDRTVQKVRTARGVLVVRFTF